MGFGVCLLSANADVVKSQAMAAGFLNDH